jgi:hypothetical protein
MYLLAEFVFPLKTILLFVLLHEHCTLCTEHMYLRNCDFFIVHIFHFDTITTQAESLDVLALKVHKHEIFFNTFLQKPKPYDLKGL